MKKDCKDCIHFKMCFKHSIFSDTTDVNIYYRNTCLSLNKPLFERKTDDYNPYNHDTTNTSD